MNEDALSEWCTSSDVKPLLKGVRNVCLVTIEDLRYWEHSFSLCNLMHGTVTFPLNSINILVQEQFGSGGLAEFKILYNFMNEILWVLNIERHCTGWHCDVVRHFWLWIMTVGSKLNEYGYESNGGLHYELYQNDGKQTADAHHLNSHHTNWLEHWKHAIPQGSTPGWHAFPHTQPTVNS